MKNPSAPIHISEEALELYSLRRLPDEELELTEEHLRVCHLCQRNLAKTGDFVRRLKAATARIEAEGRVSEPFWHRWSAIPKPIWAAACAAGLALVLFLPPRSQAPQVIALAATRGADSLVAQGVAGKPTELRLAADSVPATSSYRVEVVSAGGSSIWTGTVSRSNGIVTAKLDGRLDTGRYWVRLYIGSELTREYGLNIQ